MKAATYYIVRNARTACEVACFDGMSESRAIAAVAKHNAKHPGNQWKVEVVVL